VLANLDDAREDRFLHAMEHHRQASVLTSAGDLGGASVHRALFANMHRARN
jgi:hypothetical protein